MAKEWHREAGLYYDELVVATRPIAVKDNYNDTVLFSMDPAVRFYWSFYHSNTMSGTMGNIPRHLTLSNSLQYGAVEYTDIHCCEIYSVHGSQGLQLQQGVVSTRFRGCSGYAFANDDSTIYIGDVDSIRCWNFRLSTLQNLIASKGNWYVIALTDQDRRLITYDSTSKQLVVWDVTNNAVIHRYEVLPSNPNAFAVSQDGRSIAVGMSDGTVALYNGEGITSVKDDAENTVDQLLVYPNPSSDRITIQASASLAGHRFTIVNAIGVEVMSGILSTIQTVIETDAFSDGCYCLCVTGTSYRFVIVK
jgi:WD40 repeat protein